MISTPLHRILPLVALALLPLPASAQFPPATPEQRAAGARVASVDFGVDEFVVERDQEGTLKSSQAVGIFELATGSERRIRTSRPVTHGVVVSPDGRYAFVSNEAVGATGGTVDVIDLESSEVVATVELHNQSGGVSFWKMERGR